MTSFDAKESSLEESRPLEIYQFVLGSETFRWTSAEDDITIGSDTYTAEPGLSRSRIKVDAQGRSKNLEVTVEGTNSLASKYKNIVPGQKATLNIWRLQRDESPTFNTQSLIFKGDVLSVNFVQDGKGAEIVCRSIEQALNRNVPRFSFMGMCNHVLYGPGCGVDPSTFNVVDTVSAGGDTSTITVPAAATKVDGFFDAGFVKTLTGDEDFRLILSHIGDQLTILLPFAVDVTGQDVQAFAGCDHLISGDCATKFDNVIEFGGYAFVPNKNVFQEGLD